MTTTIIPDVHPEIPKAKWVTNRFLDDDGRIVVDEHRERVGRFEITRQITHAIDDGVADTHPENYLIKWDNQGDDGTDHEDMTVIAADLPEFLELFQTLVADVVK